MTDFQVTTDKDGALVVLKGSLGIESASELYAGIKEALEAHEVIRINMSGVDNVDLSFLQLVCSLYKAAVKEGKKLVFDQLPSRIVRKAEQMGFTEEYTGGYFWKGDENG
ncbi:STAS domain-containing protein [Desulfonatronovibrio hydrogenovorans]|uniref:STAS domain-containing protein n=1 Tax=Desulfonatronovibrio hydrogenovorans TaxID=53245 RepID=UPI00048D3EB9|nr:STAS domain-containing protein [Desulfonatronovibrio hydrogenovorans]